MSLFKESALFIKGSVREPLRLEKSDLRFVVGACSNKKCRNRFKKLTTLYTYMARFGVSVEDYKDFKTYASVRDSAYTSRVEIEAKLYKSDKEIEEERQQIKEIYEDIDAEPTTLDISHCKKRIIVRESLDTTLFGNATVNSVARATQEAKSRIKDKIDEYWANQYGEEIRKERNKEENDS